MGLFGLFEPKTKKEIDIKIAELKAKKLQYKSAGNKYHANLCDVEIAALRVKKAKL